MAWELFQWGSRGLWYKTPVVGVYMAHIFIPNGARIVVQGQGTAGQELLHTFHAINPAGAFDYAACLAVANAVSQWCTNFYKHMWASGIHMNQVVVTGTDAVPAAQATVGNTTPGDRAGISLPSSLSLTLKYATNTSGRRHRGRVYGWPAVENDYLDEDAYTPAYVTAMLGVFGNLITALNTAGYPLAIGSYTDAKVYPVLRVVAVDDIMDSRRRRTKNQGG